LWNFDSSPSSLDACTLRLVLPSPDFHHARIVLSFSARTHPTYFLFPFFLMFPFTWRAATHFFLSPDPSPFFEREPMSANLYVDGFCQVYPSPSPNNTIRLLLPHIFWGGAGNRCRLQMRRLFQQRVAGAHVLTRTPFRLTARRY